VTRTLKAALVWMDQRPLEPNHRYLLKHTSQTARAIVTSIEHRTDIGTLAHEQAQTLEMNGIGVVTVQLLRPIAVDLYGKNRSTGAFILMDRRPTLPWPQAWSQHKRGWRRRSAPAVAGKLNGPVTATSERHGGAIAVHCLSSADLNR